jgi:hypothetical protein
MEHRNVEVTWCCNFRARMAPCARLACRIGRQTWVVACMYAARVGLNPQVIWCLGLYFVRSVFLGIPTSEEGCGVSPCGMFCTF